MANQAKDRGLDQDERIQSITALGNWATAEVREPLTELLKDPEREIRAAAAEAFGWPGSREGSALPIFRRLLDNLASDSRVVGLMGVGIVGDQASVNGVATFLPLLTDESLHVRIAAIGAPFSSTCTLGATPWLTSRV